MVVNVYDSYTGYFQTTSVFTGTARPEIANPQRFATWFWNERRINGYRLATTFKVFPDDGFIEGKPAKVIILKIVPVCLFRETSISSHLQEIDAVRYDHEQFYCIHEYFLERFTYIYNWFESIPALGLVLHKDWFFSHN